MAEKPRLQKPTRPQKPAPPKPPAEMGKATKTRWPLLWTYLSERAWEDGSERQVATLLFVVDLDGFKACLNDRACGMSLWVTGSDITDLLDTLETTLGSDAPNWRAHRR